MKAPIYPGLETEMTRNGHDTTFLAKYLGLSVNAERRRENGTVEYNLPQIKRLMELYRCNFKTLFATDSDHRNSV